MAINDDSSLNGSSMTDRKIHWRCFHCGETFTKLQEKWARAHFGDDQDKTPVCLIRTAGEDALLSAYRKVQGELARYYAEDTDVLRSMWSMAADHAVALRRAEEDGYYKGVRDTKAEVK